ncbi:MAG: hypothetical protein ACI4RK_07430 [Oscillospiraceae bacterium]
MKSVRIISAAVLTAGILAGVCGCSGNTPAISGSMSVNSEESPAVSSAEGASGDPEAADSDVGSSDVSVDSCESDAGSSEQRVESVVENESDLNDDQEDEYALLQDRLPQITAAFERINRDEYSGESSEETAAAELMDRNMICAYTYHMEALFRSPNQTEPGIYPPDENGYYRIRFLLFDSFGEFREFLEKTYTKECCDRLLNGSDGEPPIFMEQEGEILFNPNRMGYTIGPYFERFDVSISSIGEDRCSFVYSPDMTGISDEEYQELLEFWGLSSDPRECQMIRENGEWRLENIAEIFGW